MNAKEISNGEFSQVVHFDEKAEVEKYIRTLPINASFVCPGCFMQNFSTMFRPQPVGDGKYAVFNILKPETEIPFVNTVEFGKFVGVILNDPQKFRGKVLYAANGLYSFDAAVKAISKVTGKPVSYQQIPVNAFKEQIPAPIAEEITEMFQFIGKYDIYGPDSKEKVEWGMQQVPEKLSTFEEFLQENPLGL